MQSCSTLRSALRPAAVPSLAPSRPVGRVFTPVVAGAAANTRRSRIAERHRRLRSKLSGTTERPRLAIFRSNDHMYAQIIDDVKGHTLLAVSTLQKAVKEELNGATANKTAAAVVGKKVAELAAAQNITKVAFDRGGFNYHGRVQAVAEAAREAGLQF